MDWFFKKLFGETLPDDDVIRWLFDTYEWLFRYHGGFQSFARDRTLIPPVNKNFPTSTTGDHAMAEEIFLRVKAYCGMAELPCVLEVHEAKPEQKYIRENLHNEEKWHNSTAGTFSKGKEGGTPRITYSPRQLENLPSLVSLFAHELSHYFLVNCPVPPPAGPDAKEPATDVCAVYLGFGIFLSNTMKDYGSGGGVSRRQGYLEEHILSYALAIFSELQGIPPKHVEKYLKTNPRSYFVSAVNDINKRWSANMQKLRTTEASNA